MYVTSRARMLIAPRLGMTGVNLCTHSFVHLQHMLLYLRTRTMTEIYKTYCRLSDV